MVKLLYISSPSAEWDISVGSYLPSNRQVSPWQENGVTWVQACDFSYGPHVKYPHPCSHRLMLLWWRNLANINYTLCTPYHQAGGVPNKSKPTCDLGLPIFMININISWSILLWPNASLWANYFGLKLVLFWNILYNQVYGNWVNTNATYEYSK